MARTEDAEAENRHDLIVLVADGTMRVAVRAILSRPRALGIREIDFRVVPHPEHDPGVFLRSESFLKPFKANYHRALVMCDRKGSGVSESSAAEMMEKLEERLAIDWQDRCAAIVFDPELENWLWSDSPEVDRVLGWQGEDPDLRSWLADNGFLFGEDAKPDRPKEAVEDALREIRKPRSSALYGQIADSVSLRRCTDPAFLRFRSILQEWFPPARG